MNTIQTSKRALRRFLLDTQLLLNPIEAGKKPKTPTREQVMDVIRQLVCVQIDPVSAVAPNQHLVLAARMPGYDPAVMNELLRGNEVFEYFANAACIIPMEQYPIFEPVRARMSGYLTPHLDEIRLVVEQVKQQLRDEGPLFAKSFQSDHRVRGYWDSESSTKATSHALNLLMDSAQIRIVGREGNQRLFDLTDRSVPAELLQSAAQMDLNEALDSLLLSYFRAYRVFDPSDPRLGWQRLNAKARKDAIDSRVTSGVVMPVEVAGVKQRYYILAEDAQRLAAHHDEVEAAAAPKLDDPEVGVHFLPPLDNVLWSRKRLVDLFDFDYKWEIYTPAVKRKYGYYAMPILAGDRLIGRMDPRLDKKQAHLSVELLQIDSDIKFTKRLGKKVEKALEVFARAHGGKTVSIEQYSVAH